MKDNDLNFDKERRKHPRIERNFILNYYDKKDPVQKHEITQLKNISQGGLCFITTQPIKSSSSIGIALKTPYIAETVHLEGEILDSHEKIKGMLYETRLEFKSLDSEAAILLTKLMEYFSNGDNKENE